MSRAAPPRHRSRPSRFPRRRLAWLVAAWSLAALAVATDYPYTTTDRLGREVTLQAAPLRIVAMIPSHTETVCALAACKLLVGVDQFSNHPAETDDLPRLGNGFEPDIEAIVALEPELVLVDQFSGLADTLSGLGLVVYAGTPQSFEETLDFFEELGRLLDREVEAALLGGRVRGEVESVAALTAGRKAPSVYFEVDATPYSVGPDSFIGFLIHRAGGANIVAAELGEFPQLDPELVVAADPEVIVLADAPFGESAEAVAARPGWAAIRAVTDRRVVELTAEQVDILSRPGPRLAEAVRLLAEIFHPELF